MMSDQTVRIGVIGGSGLYKIPQLTDIEEIAVDTPFGPPSDSILVGTLSGIRVAFIPRHGRGHVLMPSEVPYRANIYALKALGAERVIAISACGSLREDYAPGHIVVPDQLYDNTKGLRAATFFEQGLIGHVGVADPFCGDVCDLMADSVEEAGGTAHRGGGYVTIEGPRFSTRAESHIYRQWGLSIIGMTTSPEAYLAREAEMCYSVMAHVTDYDVWHESEEAVTVEMVIKIMNENVELAREALVLLVEKLATTERTCQCGDTLANALITQKDQVDPDVVEKLFPIVGRYFE